jgi:GT2 family glycosyltransferase
LDAVRKIGLPNPDYVLDWGEYEFGYRVKKAGYKSFIDRDAVMKHNVRRTQSLSLQRMKLGPLKVTFYDDPPIRCYYLCRNTLYFTLYDSIERHLGFLGGLAWISRGILWRVRSAPGRPGAVRGLVWQVLLFTANFVVRPWSQGRQIAACMRGIWHGVTGNIAARY